jgi:hypothetical protein
MRAGLIEQKLFEIDRRLAALEDATFERKPKGGWRDLVGWKEDDGLFREAMKLGAEWRARASEEGR